jgi:hypothetical protein
MMDPIAKTSFADFEVSSGPLLSKLSGRGLVGSGSPFEVYGLTKKWFLSGERRGQPFKKGFLIVECIYETTAPPTTGTPNL